MKEFKIRASSLGKIMGPLKGGITDKQLETLNTLKFKVKRTALQEEKLLDLEIKRNTPLELPETAKSYAKAWLKEELYSRRAKLKSKYLTKGNACEDESIAYVDPTWINNKEQFENDYMTGEPDVITDDTIYDLKNSWDEQTFPLFYDNIPNKDYDWQVKGYMYLTGKRKGGVIYTLMSMPENLIEREYWGEFNMPPKGDDDVMTDHYKEYRKDFIFDDIFKNLRVKKFVVEYDENAMKEVEERVVMIRNYIKTIQWTK